MRDKKRFFVLTIILVIILFGIFLFFPDTNPTVTSEIKIPDQINYSEIDYKEGKQSISIGEFEGVRINKEGDKGSIILGSINSSEGKAILQLSNNQEKRLFELCENKLRKIDLDSDGKYDIAIRLNSLNGDKANFNIERAEGEISWNSMISNEFRRALGDEDTSNETYFIFIGLVLLFIAVAGYMIHLYVMPAIKMKRIRDTEDNISALKYMYSKYKQEVNDKNKKKAKGLYERIKHFKNYMSDKEKRKTKKIFEKIERIHKQKLS